MPKVWNLGNTSVRNPNRIPLGLRVFAYYFQGAVHGHNAEVAFVKKLAEEGVLDHGGSESAWFGRKWRSVLMKLGFATHYGLYGSGPNRFDNETLVRKRPSLGLRGISCELTPVGRALLAAKTTAAVQDVFLRQLVCHEIPSPIEQEYRGGKLKPFIYLLQILSELKKQKHKGLNKLEIGLFVLPFVNHTRKAVKNVVEEIINYRQERESKENGQAKKKFDDSLTARAALAMSISKNTLRTDYPDTTFRYTVLTGILGIYSERLEIKSEKIDVVRRILEVEPLFCASEDPYKYLELFYSGISLPTDNKNFTIKTIKELTAAIERHGEKTVIAKKIKNKDKLSLANTKYALQDKLMQLAEREFAARQAGAVPDIMQYLDAVTSKKTSEELGILDKPAFFEWTVWRSFLAIDSIVIPISATRRFPLDADLKPLHPASGGGADMVFEFSDYLLVVEVTLTSSSRQEATEGAPVRKHVADIVMRSKKEVIGLFIAPEVDINTYNVFKFGEWLDPLGNPTKVNVVPLTLPQFKGVISLFGKYRFTPNEFFAFLKTCFDSPQNSAPLWKKRIDEILIEWTKAISDRN